MKNIKVAIDGPAGSGKSTISFIIAKKLGFVHIDTGAMYRAVTLLALNNNINLENEAEYIFLENSIITYENEKMFANGIDVTKEIRSERVTNNVSLVASFQYVRKKLVDLQRIAARSGNIVMDGRDIGTVVLPEAEIKIFLTANVEERAKRRCDEEVLKGNEVIFEEIVESIKIRDEKDSTRKESPLRKADDAKIIDTTNLSIDEVADIIIEEIKKEGIRHE